MAVKSETIGTLDETCLECEARAEQGYEEPCAACRREIHEGWHKAGLWWIRQEECHPGCPGLKKTGVGE